VRGNASLLCGFASIDRPRTHQRASVRMIESACDTLVRAYESAASTAGLHRQGRQAGGAHERIAWLAIRWRAAWTTVRDCQAHPPSFSCWERCSREQGSAEGARRALEAGAHRRNSLGAHHGAAGSRHGHRVHRDFLRDAVLVGHLLAPVAPASKSDRSLILTVNTQLWGGVFLLLLALVIWYKPYLWEGVFVVAANVIMGVRRPGVMGAAQALSTESTARLHRSVCRPEELGLPRDAVPGGNRSGGWFGKGYTQGTQKRLAFLPAQHTDFIFSVLGESSDFSVSAGAGAVSHALPAHHQDRRARERQLSSLVSFGLLASWFVHVLVNVGMTLNLMPVTGIPLPFFSYGGSFMLSSWLAIGVIGVSRMKEGVGSTVRLLSEPGLSETEFSKTVFSAGASLRSRLVCSRRRAFRAPVTFAILDQRPSFSFAIRRASLRRIISDSRSSWANTVSDRKPKSFAVISW